MSSRSSRATFFMAFGFSANFLSSLTCCWNCCGYWGCCGSDAACPRTSATKHSDTYWLYFILKRKFNLLHHRRSIPKERSIRWLIRKESPSSQVNVVSLMQHSRSLSLPLSLSNIEWLKRENTDGGPKFKKNSNSLYGIRKMSQLPFLTLLRSSDLYVSILLSLLQTKRFLVF